MTTRTFTVTNYDNPVEVFPTPENMLESVPNRDAIYHRLELRFRNIEKQLCADGRGELDYLLTSTANEWDASLSVIQTTYQKLLAKMKENCAKAVCPMCHADDPRFDVDGHEVHSVTVAPFRDTAGNIPPQKQVVSVVRCAANSIWSMK